MEAETFESVKRVDSKYGKWGSLFDLFYRLVVNLFLYIFTCGPYG